MGLETLVLNRFGYGPRPGDITAVTGNLNAYLVTQYSPPPSDDPQTQAALALQTLNISYVRVADGVQVNQNRPLQYLYSTQAQLWPLQSGTLTPDPAERFRPANEIIAASIVRAVISPYQIREAMVQFWLNHFSINALDIEQTAVGYPVYDQFMRANALGNFRTILGLVAKSVSMMYFLNQEASNKIQPNENYARELMELHTLGIQNYYGRTGSNPNGYTDDDVIAAAKALTGWTIGTGFITASDGTRPSDGRFIFAPSLHDTSPKSPLGLSFDGTTGQQEGEAILDYLSRHPGTAAHMAAKLCTAFVSDSPSAGLVQSIANVWLAAASAPDQIAQVVNAIIASAEFAASQGAKVKDPFRFVVSALRATQASWQVSGAHAALINSMGYPVHQWPTPDGIPLTAASWSGANSLLQRFNAAVSLFTSSTYTAFNPALVLPKPLPSAPALAQYYANVVVPTGASSTSVQGLSTLAASSTILGSVTSSSSASTIANRLGLLVAAAVSMPEFQVT